MAVQFESDGGTVFCAANSNAAITVPLPATRPVGSVLMLVGFSRLITDVVGTAPAGYTLMTGFPKSSVTAAGGRVWVYTDVADGTEVAPSFACTSAVTGNSGDLWGACLYCYSGVNTSNILDGTPTVTDASGTTTCTYPALTITTADAMVVRFLARFRDAADTFTPTATWNEREDLGTTVRLGGQHHLQDKLATASGAQAAVTVAPSVTTASRYLAVTLALRAAIGVNHSVPISDAVGLGDAPVSGRGIGRSLSDTATFADARTRQIGFGRTLADTFALADLADTDLTGAADPNAFPRQIALAL